jgi:hypothetical protein
LCSIVSVVVSCYTGYFVVLSCIRRRVYLILLSVSLIGKNGDDSQQSYPVYPFMADPNWRRPIDRVILEVILQKADRWTILSTLIGECNALCTLRTHSVDIKIK